jgi:single-strand DNA-binding protein
MFRRLAEATAKYLQKGRLVGIEGRIASRAYETTEGEKRRVIEVIADRLRFLDPPIVVGDEEEQVPAPRSGSEG